MVQADEIALRETLFDAPHAVRSLVILCPDQKAIYLAKGISCGEEDRLLAEKISTLLKLATELRQSHCSSWFQ
jgi:hypothetical protein